MLKKNNPKSPKYDYNIKFVNQNEYIILKKDNKTKNIGLYTEGLASCSCVILSIINDEVIFMSHIDETTDFKGMLYKYVSELQKEKNIIDIKFLYTLGTGPNYNEINFEKRFKNIINEIESNNQFIKKIEILKPIPNDFVANIFKFNNKDLFKKIKNKIINNYQKCITNAKSNLSKSIYEKELKAFTENKLFDDNNIIFNYDSKKMKTILSSLKIGL